MTRGLMVVSTLSQLYGDRPLSAIKRRHAYIVGWCIEFLQASSWIDIDIIDDSTKRNKLCWHRNENVGMMAVNDSCWLVSSAYVLLNDEFHHHPCYANIMDLLHTRSWWDYYAPENNTDIFNFTVERLQAVIRYRTTYFGYYLPIATALYLAGVKREVVNGPVLNILLAIGEFYHNQDDFHGWFDPRGKVNMNVRNNRCTWLIVEALRKANAEQKANYGRLDEGCVEKVKAVYESLNLLKLFMEYEEQSYRHVKMLINKYSEILPTCIFHELTDKIYFRRTKYFYVRFTFTA